MMMKGVVDSSAAWRLDQRTTLEVESWEVKRTCSCGLFTIRDKLGMLFTQQP